MNKYSAEENALILVALLKKYGIRNVIASPGTTNLAFVASLQYDSFFKVYSAPEERVAAYMACGMAQETGEPVVITCTGATASRNYLPGLTEAFYRKLPVLAVTATQGAAKVGHLIAQVIDRSNVPADCVKLSVELPTVIDGDGRWNAVINANKALNALWSRGGGPVHINLATSYAGDFSIEKLPEVKRIGYYENTGQMPEIPSGKIGVFIGAHSRMSDALTAAIDNFCAKYDSVVFCDHTSNYKGRYRIQSPLLFSQDNWISPVANLDLMIHIGEVSGSYAFPRPKSVWRVSPDGEIRDTFRKLDAVFAVGEDVFFSHYASGCVDARSNFYNDCKALSEELHSEIPESLPFSNVWIAGRLSAVLPEGSVLSLGILNSLRAWNFFDIPDSVNSYSNVGGFGIDGCLSTLIGSALAEPDKIFYAILGDLAFFYDMNALGNRHLPPNIRIMLVNNGRGTEFRNYNHMGAAFGDDADEFIAAAAHYGNKSRNLARHYAEDLGFEYLFAESKAEINELASVFVSPESRSNPLLLEVFTDSAEEDKAVYMMRHLRESKNVSPKEMVRDLIGTGNIRKIKGLFGH